MHVHVLLNFPTLFHITGTSQLHLHDFVKLSGCTIEFFCTQKLLLTIAQSITMILYLLNPIVTLAWSSDIYRACLVMNRRAASYRMLMICCCCWGGIGCKPPTPRGSETGVSCTACILMKLHIVNESRIWMQTKMRLNPTDLPLIAPMKQCANWYQDDVDRYDNSSRSEHQQLYRQSDLHSFRCSVCI